jgi:hypothetical protein
MQSSCQHVSSNLTPPSSRASPYERPATVQLTAVAKRSISADLECGRGTRSNEGSRYLNALTLWFNWRLG